MRISTQGNVVVLGYSDIVRRRVVPALRSMPGVKIASIAGRALSETDAHALAIDLACPVYHGAFAIEEALSSARPGTVAYVSGANRDHAERVVCALKAGLHVIVDKPAWLTESEGKIIEELASQKALFVDEAMVWASSSLARWWLGEVKRVVTRPIVSSMQFTIPTLGADNFRMAHDAGSGPIWDLGPYFISQIQELSRCMPGPSATGESRSITIDTVRRDGDGLYTLEASCADFVTRGVIGFGWPYVNSLEASTADGHAAISPAFTEPESRPRVGGLEFMGVQEQRVASSQDGFANFISEFLGRVGRPGSVGIDRQLRQRLDLVRDIHSRLGA